MPENTLLIVDDSPNFRTSIREAVKEASIFKNIIEAGDGAAAISIFASNNITFIITDVVMPRIDGYKLVSAIRGTPAGRDIPIIILTSSRKEYCDKVKGLMIGASDYVIKPFNKDELIARIRVLLRMQELQEELKAKNALLERLSTTDELTGLPNRRYFFDSVKTIIALAKRNNLPIACLMLDIDFFKKINDKYGHLTGDIVLKAVSEIMLRSKRDGELLARFGGEEFVMCLFKADETASFCAAERFRKTIEAINIPVDEMTVSLTVSIGCASIDSDKLEDADELISRADDALYRAKKNGRNRSETYSGHRYTGC